MTLTKTKIGAIISVATLTAGQAIKIWQVNSKPVPIVEHHYHNSIVHHHYKGGNHTSIGTNSSSQGGPGEGCSTGSDMMLYSVSENFSFIGNLFIESQYLFTYSIIPIMLLLLSCLVSYFFVKRCKHFFTNTYILRLLQLADLNRKIQVWCLLAILSFTIVFDIFCIIYWG